MNEPKLDTEYGVQLAFRGKPDPEELERRARQILKNAGVRHALLEFDGIDDLRQGPTGGTCTVNFA